MSIVVAYTPDEFGGAALSYGVAEAALRGERMVVVNGTRGDAFVDTSFASSEHMAHLDERVKELGVEHEVRQVLGPDVSDEILAVAQEVDATVIVIGLRRRSPVGKLFMGSVAQRLLLDAACPVFAVKPGDGADSVG